MNNSCVDHFEEETQPVDVHAAEHDQHCVQDAECQVEVAQLFRKDGLRPRDVGHVGNKVVPKHNPEGRAKDKAHHCCRLVHCVRKHPAARRADVRQAVEPRNHHSHSEQVLHNHAAKQTDSHHVVQVHFPKVAAPLSDEQVVDHVFKVVAQLEQ